MRDALNDMMAEAKKIKDGGLQKTYIINTQVLIWEGTLTYRINQVKLNYQILMHHESSQLFVLSPKTREDLELTFNILPMDVKRMYELMLATAMIAKPTQLHTGEEITAKRIILKKLVEMLKAIDPTALTDNAGQQSSYQTVLKTNAFVKKTQVLLFLKRQVQKTSFVPRLSKSIYKEKTIIYREMGQGLMQKEAFENLNQGQKSLLKISKIKTQTQRLISAKEQSNLINSHTKQEKLVETFAKERLEHEKEVKSKEKGFKAAVRAREFQVYGEAIIAVVDAGITIFSSILNPANVFNGLMSAGKKAKKLFELLKLLSTIKNIIKKLRELRKVTKKFFVKVMSKFKNLKELEVITAQHSLKLAKAGMNPGDITQMVEEVGEIDASDLLKWDIVIKDVETMMDSGLTTEVPETYG